MTKKTVVCHSGGMDSSICLAMAIREFGKEQVVSLSFNYEQRHSPELAQAVKICRDWEVEHRVLTLECYRQMTDNALLNHEMPIVHLKGSPPNTLVAGRNGIMAHLAAVLANHLSAHQIMMGVMELEGANSGYRDCNRAYMDLMQQVIRLDLDDPLFEIATPIIHMTKQQTIDLAFQMGILPYLLAETITCYLGQKHPGCESCPACLLKNDGLKSFIEANPHLETVLKDVPEMSPPLIRDY
jgi:7-cyano-7-deazaguanine synthase